MTDDNATPEEIDAMRRIYPDGLPPGSMNEQIYNAMMKQKQANSHSDEHSELYAKARAAIANHPAELPIEAKDWDGPTWVRWILECKCEVIAGYYCDQCERRRKINREFKRTDELRTFNSAAHPAAVLALIDEVRRLRQAEIIMNLDRVALQENAQHDRARIRTLTADYERLAAENERMRKALSGIVDLLADGTCSNECAKHIRDYCSDALAGERGKA